MLDSNDYYLALAHVCKVLTEKMFVKGLLFDILKHARNVLTKAENIICLLNFQLSTYMS